MTHVDLAADLAWHRVTAAMQNLPFGLINHPKLLGQLTYFELTIFSAKLEGR